MIPECVNKNDIRRYSRLLGIKNPNQLEYKKLSYFYWKRLKSNTGNIKKTKELLNALHILEEFDISLIKKILLEESNSLPEKLSTKSTKKQKDRLNERMSRAFDKNKKEIKKVNLSIQTQVKIRGRKYKEIEEIKSDLCERMTRAFAENKNNINISKKKKSISSKQNEEKSKCYRYSNFLDELNLIERIWRELYSKNKNFSYSYGINFYINFLRNHSKFIDLQGATKLRNVELPFICNHGHYRTSTIEGIFQNFACPTCKSSSSRLYPIQVEKIYKKLRKEFCFNFNTGIKLYSLLKRKLIWRCQNNRNHLFDATISQRLFSDMPCQSCEIIKNIENQTQDLIIKEDFINKNFTLQCTKNNNHNYEISLKDSFHKKIECPICIKDMRKIKVNNWRSQDRNS
jgi:hypothetical protein